MSPWPPSCEWKDLPTTSNKAPTGLIDHLVYKVNYFVENCPTLPKGFKNCEGHIVYYESLIACLQEVWRPYLTALGVEQEFIDLVAYGSNVNTPCDSDSQNLAAFYCLSNTIICVSRRRYEYDVDCGQYVTQTTIHGHFHYMQSQLGTLSTSKESDADEMKVSRCIELQDICSTPRPQLTLNLGTAADDYKGFLKTPLGDEGHGTKETITHWRNRGFYMTTLQGCNAWGVSSRRVA